MPELLIRRITNGVRITWTPAAGTGYRLQRCLNLADGTWNEAAEFLPPVSGIYKTSTPSDCLYYRLRTIE